MSAPETKNNAPRSALTRRSGKDKRSAPARLSGNSEQRERKNERGSALVYILIAIALLAALTVTFMEPSSQQTSSQAGFRTATELKSQVDTIRSAVQECVLRYGRGDTTPGIQISDPGANQLYPLKPNSTYLASPDTDRFVKDLRCPGNNTGTTNDHVDIWTGGKFMPTPPDLFEEWQWYNGTDGVFFWTRTTKSDSFLRSALEKLDDNLSECEADVITSSGSANNLDVAGTVNCPANNVCFRIWMINPGTGPHADDNIDTACGGSDLP